MSKYVDPENLSPEDVEYIKQRPPLRQEFILNGFGDPLDPEYPGLNFDPSELDDSDDSDDSEATSPASDGDTENPDDADTEDDEDEEDEAPDPIELSDEQKWDQSMSKSNLEQVVEARNSDRDPESDWYITPSGSNKGDLVSALQADDSRIEQFNNSLG
jgi:hypothetical protein